MYPVYKLNKVWFQRIIQFTEVEMRTPFLLILVCFTTIEIFAQPAVNRLIFDKVVIDAGHGGYDSGARGSASKEKDITLAIAVKTGRLIKENLPGVEVIFTRDSDVFVPLHRRAEIANENGADLFISIHCNSNLSPKPFGAETYVMGLHKSTENLEVAKTENMAILMEENYDENYDGFDPESDEDYILLNMFQHNAMDHSIHFSTLVQNNLKTTAGLYDRGVKQAGFVVLYLTTMPGVLIETGFLSNPAEEQFLLQTANQTKIAEAIYLALKDFKTHSDALFEMTEIAQNSATHSLLNDKSEVFKIAFLQTDDLLPFDHSQFTGLNDLMAFKIGERYIYTFGTSGNKEEATQLLNEKRRQKELRKTLKNARVVPVIHYH
jgi:N-acetylmuramoyl-L-alanine amidase